MSGIVIKLRYPPNDPAGRPEIQKTDLVRIAGETGVDISLMTFDHENSSGSWKTTDAASEDVTIEYTSQHIITVTSDDEMVLRSAVRLLIGLYRAPRTVYGTWGSSEKGTEIISELLDEGDGWY